MKKIKKILRNLYLTFHNIFVGLDIAQTEMLGQKTQSLGKDGVSSEVQSESQNVFYDLKQGRVTKEVKMLRYKMYLTALEATKRKISNLTINDFTGEYKVETTKKYKKRVSGDPTNDECVEIILFNNLSIIEGTEKTFNRVIDGIEKNINVESNIKINVNRGDKIPKLFIENYVEYLYVRKIEDDKKIIELYINKYQSEDILRKNVLLKNIERKMNGVYRGDIFEIENITFETNNCYGIDDFYILTYKIDSFYKIIEHNGFYIIKYYATLEDIYDIMSDVYDENQALLYKNKELKKNEIGLKDYDEDKYEKDSLIDRLIKGDI